MKIIVGKNLKEKVLQGEKNIVLAAHAHWCQECPEFMKMYEELARKLHGKVDIVFAKWDAANNESPDFEPRTMPYVKVYKKGSKRGVEFNEKKDRKTLIKFLETVFGEQLNVYLTQNNDEL